MYTHRIVHIGTGVRDASLRFTSKAEAERWLASYQVSQQYKDANYRIVPDAPPAVPSHPIELFFADPPAEASPQESPATMKYPIGTQFKTPGKNPQVCTVADILKTYNNAGELVRTRYVATHEFCGQTVADRDVCDVTIARGFVSNPFPPIPADSPQHTPEELETMRKIAADLDARYVAERDARWKAETVPAVPPAVLTDQEWKERMFTAWRANDQREIQNLLDRLPPAVR